MENKLNVIIAGVSHLQKDFNYTMEELAQLAAANNMNVVADMRQNIDYVVSGTYFGQGKIKEIKEMAEYKDAQAVVVNDNLTPSQIRNLGKAPQLSFIDRTELILQVFANRAKTRQAQVQVEIAQLQYKLPRIHPSGNPLDQQRGASGLANRGAGESQLELDRRAIRKRITTLKRELQQINKSLAVQGKQRTDSALPTVALVGYTNAGKSTTMNGILNLMNDSADKKVFEKDMLFATLDTSVRRIHIPDEEDFLLSDTVGFVSKLPHNLIESFQSTLSEAKDADLLIQVVDGSDPHYEEMIKTTNKTLADIGIANKPIIYAYNKADKKPDFKGPEIDGDNIYYSARDQTSIEALLKLIYDNLFKNYKNIKIFIPFTDGKATGFIQDNLTIKSQEYNDKGTIYHLFVSPANAARMGKYVIDEK